MNKSAGVPAHHLMSLATLSRLYEYLVHRSGPLASPIVGAQALVHSTVEPRENVADIQLYLLHHPATFGVGVTQRGLTPQVFEAEFAKATSPNLFSVGSCLQKPKSRGEIRLQSSDPLVAPLIDPKYLTHPRDIQALVSGAKMALDIVENGRAMGELDPQSVEKHIPGCEEHYFNSDQYLECSVTHRAMAFNHASTTCRMGKNPSNSVVDSRLRVHGVENLRVVDASVFPEIVAGNINISTIALAEKAADMIKEDRKRG